MRGWPLVCVGFAAVLFALCLFPQVSCSGCLAAPVVTADNAVPVQVVEVTSKAPSVYWWIAFVGAVINTVIGFITANPPKNNGGGK